MNKTTPSPARAKSAARQLAETFTAETLDSLIKDAVRSGTPIDGADGLLHELTKGLIERALDSEQIIWAIIPAIDRSRVRQIPKRLHAEIGVHGQRPGRYRGAVRSQWLVPAGDRAEEESPPQ